MHLRAVVDGDVAVSWIRRTRIEGDVWQSYEVPLGEDREAYLVRVSSGGVVLREAEVLTPEFTYTTAMFHKYPLSLRFNFPVRGHQNLFQGYIAGVMALFLFISRRNTAVFARFSAFPLFQLVVNSNHTW